MRATKRPVVSRAVFSELDALLPLLPWQVLEGSTSSPHVPDGRQVEGQTSDQARVLVVARDHHLVVPLLVCAKFLESDFFQRNNYIHLNAPSGQQAIFVNSIISYLSYYINSNWGFP